MSHQLPYVEPHRSIVLGNENQLAVLRHRTSLVCVAESSVFGYAESSHDGGEADDDSPPG